VVQAGRLEDSVARKFFKQLVSGVEYIHNNMICHLDLSLENMLLSENEELKICDFGLAREMKDISKFPAELRNKPGKLGYMAPEIFAGQPFDGKLADIYSMGVILFIILTGVPPFEMSSDSDARFRLIYNGYLRKLLKTWNFLGIILEEAIDLLSHMLCPVEKRFSLENIIVHPWFKKVDK